MNNLYLPLAFHDRTVDNFLYKERITIIPTLMSDIHRMDRDYSYFCDTRQSILARLCKMGDDALQRDPQETTIVRVRPEEIRAKFTLEIPNAMPIFRNEVNILSYKYHEGRTRTFCEHNYEMNPRAINGTLPPQCRDIFSQEGQKYNCEPSMIPRSIALAHDEYSQLCKYLLSHEAPTRFEGHLCLIP